MPKKEVLEMCERAIRDDMGALDDLPYELANTVANVYYRYYNHTFDVMSRATNNPGWIPKEMQREVDMAAGLTSFIDDSAKIMSDYEAAQKSVELIREIDKHREPDLYQSIVDFTLDCLKYDIKDAHKKIGLRRMIERKLIKARVQEIPNLVDLLDI